MPRASGGEASGDIPKKRLSRSENGSGEEGDDEDPKGKLMLSTTARATRPRKPAQTPLGYAVVKVCTVLLR